MFNLGELVRRAIKYLVEGLMVALAAYSIPKVQLKMDEVALFHLLQQQHFYLDTYVPTIAGAARGGAGFGIGANLVGFPA